MAMKERLEEELHRTMDRLRQLGGAVMIEEYPGASADNSPPADSMDEVQMSEAREIGFATLSRLVRRANRLAEALHRLRQGEYGICAECGESIAPARLQALPEVTTCIRCQDHLERLHAPGRGVGDAGDDLTIEAEEEEQEEEDQL